MKDQRVLWATMFAVVIGLTMVVGVASAHHSRAGYGETDQTVRGVVAEYKWRNPHVFIVWNAKGNDGKVVQWVGELSSINTMLSLGMTKDSVKVGDEIVVSGITAKAGTPQMVIRNAKKADGTVVIEQRGDIRQP